MPKPAFKRPESVLVVVHSGDRVLLLERRSPPGFWQSVTGSLREGEPAADCARRELAEETGYPADGLRDLALTQRFPIAPAWRHRYAPPRLNPREHLAFRWLAPDEAVTVASSWTDRTAIARVFDLPAGAGGD